MSTLKDTIHRTVHGNKKSARAIAEELAMNYGILIRCSLPDPEESDTGSGCSFPLKRLIPLIRCTNDYQILDYIEDALGRVAIPIPKEEITVAGCCRLTMHSVAEFGQLVAEMEKACADRRITDIERERILKEGYEAIQAIVHLLESVRRAK
jgi:hypothetical protein